MSQSSPRALGRRLVLGGAVALGAGVLAAAPAGAQDGVRALGIDTTNFDRSVRPQDDFFRFVNGGWIQRTEIPQDASSWGAFNELREKSRTALHAIVDEAMASHAPAGSEMRKVGDLYASYMDSARVDSLGLTPLQGELRAVAAVKTPAQLPAAFAHFARVGVQGPLGVGVGPDQKQSSVNVVTVNQSGLGLPDRDYYLLQDAKMVTLRQAYQGYVTRLLTLAHQPDPEGAASRILALETAIAGKHWDRARSRDRNATYNKMSVAQLAALSPSYDWHAYLTAAGLGKATEVVVRQPDYVHALDSIVANTPAATWREYLTFKLLDTYADELPSAFQEARFMFRGRTLSGQQQQSARWKRGVDEVEGALGEAVGKLYVERNFKPEAKARMDAMIRNLRAAYEVGIDSLEWMSPATKAQAKDKLAHFTVKIAYPDKWRDYSALAIKRDDLLGNELRANEFQYADMAGRLGKPVDRTRWGMTPQTVNAYYNATNNEIVFPAAILQPPFFDVTADDAVNYGAIGAVIGHEIGHGFDDQGRKSDGAGNLRDWWTPADAQAFEERTSKLGAQYEAISPLEGTHINGKLTMGENIGDLSGLAQAYRAYHISLGGKPAPVIGGYTGDQRFFMGYAQIWRAKFRDEALRQQLLSNPHSPGMARAFVPLVNNDAFDRAFDVKEGDRMYRAPADRVKIW
ncbi:MAG TPA: M13 family metallopeptidase [Gemmatimonadaceae bacterium]|nr:M13 family metallopeptidase [Gemmatimonadaceae bacterium]